MDYCKEWFSAVETPIGIVVLLGLAICLILSYGAVDWVRQHHNAAPAITASAFALTGIVGGVISATVNNCFMGRYAFPGMCFVMLWYAVGFSQILDTAKEKNKKWWVGGILAPAMLCFLLQYVYHPELHYYLLGYKLYSLPFVNTEALTNYSQLETYDNLWYICFQGGVPNEVEGEYRYEEAVKFHYMYYDFVVYRLERIVQE